MRRDAWHPCQRLSRQSDTRSKFPPQPLRNGSRGARVSRRCHGQSTSARRCPRTVRLSLLSPRWPSTTHTRQWCALFPAFVRGHETKQPQKFLHPYFHLAYMASCEQADFFRDTKPLHAKFQKIRNTLELLSRLSYCQEYTSMSRGERRVIFDSHPVKRSGPRIGMRSTSNVPIADVLKVSCCECRRPKTESRVDTALSMGIGCERGRWSLKSRRR